jgi:catalase
VAAASLLTPGAMAQTHASAGTLVDPSAFVDQFEATFGKFEGYRRSGAKGICAMAEFVGTADTLALSTASVFSGKAVPVVVRFSVGGAILKAPDNARTQSNLALQFDLPNGEKWQMGNISAPVFGDSSPQQFIALIASCQPDPATKTADPAKVKAFNDANPEILLLGKYLASQPVPARRGRCGRGQSSLARWKRWQRLPRVFRDCSRRTLHWVR